MLEKTLESPLDSEEIKPVSLNGNQSWIFIGRTDAEAETLATWCKELTHWKRSWCWERLKAGGEGDDRGWDGWKASLTWWTWVWASSGSWWWTEKTCAAVHEVAKSRTQLSDWTELNWHVELFWLTLKCENKLVFLQKCIGLEVLLVYLLLQSMWQHCMSFLCLLMRHSDINFIFLLMSFFVFGSYKMLGTWSEYGSPFSFTSKRMYVALKIHL